jgi:hypothetical protein
MIRIVVALTAEARPLRERYGLKARTPRGLFPVYENDQVALIVSGIGKVAAGAATAYLHALMGEEANAGWLNVGVAGHPGRRLGRGAIATRITDAATQRRWFPPQIVEFNTETDYLITVDSPESTYQEQSMYDMEAAGFYATALHCSTGELIQCYKIVSDNRDDPSSQVTPKRVEKLIGERIDEVSSLVQQLSKLSAELALINAEPVGYEQFIGNWRFSVSQRHKLRRLLERFSLLVPHQPVVCEEFAGLCDARDVLSALEDRVNALALKSTRVAAKRENRAT